MAISSQSLLFGYSVLHCLKVVLLLASKQCQISYIASSDVAQCLLRPTQCIALLSIYVAIIVRIMRNYARMTTVMCSVSAMLPTLNMSL